MQIKANLKFPLTPVGVAKINNEMKTYADVDVGKGKHSLLAGVQIDADTVEIPVEVPQKPRNRFTI